MSQNEGSNQLDCFAKEMLMEGIGGTASTIILEWNDPVNTTMFLAFDGTKIPFAKY